MNFQRLSRSVKIFFNANTLLLLLLCFMIFGTTLLPESWYRTSYSVLVNLILICVIFCLDSTHRLFSSITVTILIVFLNIAFFHKNAVDEWNIRWAELSIFYFRCLPFIKAGSRIKTGDGKSYCAVDQWLPFTGSYIFYGCCTVRFPSARSIHVPCR